MHKSGVNTRKSKGTFANVPRAGSLPPWAGLCVWTVHAHAHHVRVWATSAWWWAARVEFIFPFLKELEIALYFNFLS